MLTTCTRLIALALCLSLLVPDAFARGGGGGRAGGGGGGFGGGGGGGGAARGGMGGGGNFGGGGGGNFGGGGGGAPRAGGAGGGNFGGAGGGFGGGGASGGFGGGAARTNVGGGGGFGGEKAGGFGGAGGGFSGMSGAGAAGARTNVGGAGQFGGGEGREASPSANSYNRPQQNQLNSFLNLPASSGAGEARSASTLSSTGGTGSKSYTTQGGTTITAGKGSGSYTTAGGTTIGGAGAGIKVEGSGGQTYAKGVGAVGGTNGTNSAIRAGSATGFENAAGDKAANVRGGYANSSGYRQAGSVTAVQGKNGYTAVNARGAAGVGGTGVAGSATAIRGPNGNTIAAGRGAAFTNGQFFGGQTWSAVNGSYRHWNYYTPNWYGRYPGCWYPNRWAVGLTAWTVANWATASTYCGVQDSPTYYDYDSAVTYNDDGNVYYGDEPVATTEQYYAQAANIASAGQTTDNEEWMPLGVFALLSKDEQTKTDKTIQLALNKAGVIRGNLEDSLSDTVTPVSGSVDKETQRVAFTVKGNERAVIETGLYNLTNDEVPVLVHLGADQVQKHVMIRLQPPAEESKQ